MAKHKKHDEEHMSEAWLIPYADVLTLLLAVFIILFSTSQVDKQKFTAMAETFSVIFSGGSGILDSTSGEKIAIIDMTSPTSPNDSAGQAGESGANAQQSAAAAAASEAAKKAMQQDMQKLTGEIQQYIKDNNMGGELEVTMNSSGEVVITIKERALFSSGSADITSEYRPTITDIAKILKTHSQVKVTVAGYTDNVPISSAQFVSNWELSSARAATCNRLLIEDSGLNPGNFNIEAYGEYHPIATNDTAEGRSMNRRVEFKIRGIVDESSIVIPIN